MLGPFHIFLNAMENLFPFTTPSSQVSKLFAQNLSLTLHSTLDLYKHLFGRRKMLPRKPRFHRMATLIACLFGGWLTVRDDVLGIFGVCKDTEFLAMRQLLDENTPRMSLLIVAECNYTSGYYVHCATATQLQQSDVRCN